MDGDVSEDWLIGRRIPIFCVCCAMFSFFLFSLFSCNQIYERERGVSNKQEERDERMGEKKDPLCTLKIRNRQKVHKRDPGKKKKKRARLCVCTLNNSYSSRRADLTR